MVVSDVPAGRTAPLTAVGRTLNCVVDKALSVSKEQ